MNIRVRINKIISCILVAVMVISCMGNAAPALAEGLASLEANNVPVVYAGEETTTGSVLKFDFGDGAVEDGFTKVTASTTYSAEKGYGLVVGNGPVANQGIGGTGNLMSDSVRVLYEANKVVGTSQFVVDLLPGRYNIKLGTGHSGNYSTNIVFKDATGDTLCEGISVTESGTYHEYERKEIEITDGKLVLDISSGGTRFATIAYLELTKLYDTKEWTFDEGDLDIKGDGFATSNCTDKAIGTTGCKLSVAGAGNYSNAIIRNNSSANAGYWPFTQPVDNGYYLFLGAGNANDNTAMTITLPETVPAGKAIDIEFVKISGSNKAGNNRGAANSAQSIVIDTTTIDVQSGYEFSNWNTKTVITENETSTITVKLGKWAAIGIKSITARETTPEDFESVTVEFNMNGHGDDIEAQELSVGGAVVEPDAPRAEGYVFRGWYTDEACTIAWNFATGVEADTTLYARWIEDPAANNEDALYSQYFSDVTDATKVVTGSFATKTIEADDAHGYYLSVTDGGTGGRNATVDFGTINIASKKYSIEFDMAVTPGNDGSKLPVSQYIVKGTDFAFAEGAATGYILELANGGGSSQTYTVNDNAEKTVTITTGEWCHYELVVDTEAGTVTVSIKGATTNVEDLVVAYNGNGKVAGLYGDVGRYNPKILLDNIEVCEIEDAGEEPGEGPEEPGEDPGEDPVVEALYSQNFTDVTDASTVATSTSAQDALTIGSDETHGKYLSYDLTPLNPSGGRGAYTDFAGLDVSAKNIYIVEFDMAMRAANNKASEFAVKGADFKYTGNAINNGAGSGFLLKLANAGAGSTKYAVNGTDNTLTIPDNEWCHYKLYVDKTLGKIALTITGTTTGKIADKLIVSYDGAGNVAGLYMMGGRYTGAFSVDNIIVRELADGEEAEIKSGEDYSLIKEATGNSTAVDCSTLVFTEFVKGYRVTTVDANGNIVKQYTQEAKPTTVDTTGATKLEITPIFYYEIGTPGESGYNISLPAGSYDFTVYNTSGSRCDVYANDQMLVNNLLQNGSTPNYFTSKDIVITGNTITIKSADAPGSVNLQVEVMASPSIANRVKKVYVLGDSLVAMYYNGGSSENNVQTGWGQVLANYLVDSVDVVDLANSGITANGLYTTAFSQIKGSAKAGDILILESGYNDKSYDTKEIMVTAVTNMVNEAEALGVEVILVSPNASDHDYKESVAWTSYMAEVAAAEDVTYIDLSKLSYQFLFGLYGADTTVIKADYNVSDRLHSTYNGAHKWASIVAGELYKVEDLKSLVNADYVYAFADSAGNVISCSATGKLAEGYYKVTFDMNGKETANLFKTVKSGEKVVRPNNPAASGCVFDGWFKDAECTVAWDFDVDVITAATTIYAKWLENAAGTLYSQNFNAVNSADSVATAQRTDALKLGTSAELGNYLSYDFSSISENSRGLDMAFAGLDVSELTSYVVEFDAAIKPGNGQTTYFSLKGSDFAYLSGQVNWGTDSGYIINIDNSAAPGTASYVLNGSVNVDIPSGEWCHYVVYVDKDQKLVTTTITSATKTVLDKSVTAYSGGGDLVGLYMLAGRYYPVMSIDNILVREVGEYDEFGEVIAESLLNVEFTSGLNTVITQPAEGSSVHKPIVLKANGNLGGDLTDKVSVVWSVVGLEKEDGYISLTKASGTGAGTDGVAPDGTSAYFNVRNGVSNYFGYVQAVVTYGEDSVTVITPFAVIGATGADANKLAPAVGYPVNMDDYADSLVGYYGTSNAETTKDLVLNNWSIYGSNAKRTLRLVKQDGKKALEFASNGGSGSTVAVYQWADQSSQYVIDFTAKFTSDMAFGVYYKTPNNGGNNPEWTASFGSGSMTLGSESVTGLSANEWYRVMVTADPSVQKVGLAVYDMSGELLGEIKDIDMTNDTSVQKYFCFHGTWPMYLNSFQAYKPSLSTITVGSDADTVKVPENGAAAATVALSAVLKDAGGLEMTGAVEWSLAEDYAGVELTATGSQTATLTISEGASGAITIVATKDGKQGEKTIQLTTSSNVVSFSQSTSSITIPFAGEDAFVCNFKAVTLSGEGEQIDGGAITYALLAKDGVTETTVKGVTFANGVLTVAAGASPAVIYIKATNAEGLSAKVKVNIHGLSFAFGSADAAEGFTQVEDTMYTAKLGYGFANTTGMTVNAGNVTSTADFRFKANVPNGNYTVKVNTTSASMLSEVVESVSATTGITKTGSTFNVAVCDGVLDLTFLAGSNVTSVEISQMTAKTALEKPMIYAIGDSTTKNNASGALSWGNCVADGKVIVPSAFSGFSNHGMAGRDSVNYYNQGRVEAVLLAVCPGDYVTVNMGINSKETGEAASYETLLSEYYVEGIIQRGGIPVIVTATPDGPVGDRVATNYDSTTGKFTNSRGDGARNDVLRKIAADKGLALIELGQWGQDWMNTLTAADVTAYNKANGTSYATVLEMVQSWYVDHNHYKEYLGIIIGEYLLGELNDMAAPKDGIIYDFQNELNPSWGMTGDLSGSVSIVDDAANVGNKYLQLTHKEARNTTTLKVFEDLPKMTEAEFAFKLYAGGQTSTSRMGYTGIKLMSGDTELVALYFGELRAAGDTSSIWYSNAGFDAKVESSVKITKDNWYDVSVEIDFANDTLDVYVGSTKIASGLAIDPVVQNVDTFAFMTFDPNGGTKVTPTVGIDDVTISYIEKTAEDDVVTIYSLAAIENISVTKAQWNAGYTHPTEVEATLSNGDIITVQIKADTWNCLDFDVNVKAAYTWTAEIIAPAEYANTKGLEVSYVMEYNATTSSRYDYYNDFTFASEIIPQIAWGKSMDSTSGSGYFNLSHAFSNGDGYMYADITGNGDRGSRLDLTGGIVRGANFTFDWMPINNNGSAYGQLLFVSNSVWHSYFTLRFDEDYNISVFTENPLGMCSTTQEPFEGSISAANAIDTGLGGQNTWFTVSVTFDYLAHTADITITEKANPENTFTQAGIPIDPMANGTRSMVLHMSKRANGANVAMGLDNIAIKYTRFTKKDVVKVTNPANVAVAKVAYDDFVFPGVVTVGLGDGSSAKLLVKKWTATPEFDPNVAGEYVWTADAVFGEYTNYFDLQPSFTMTYTMNPYPIYVYSPTTLELEFGEELPSEFPTTVIAHMSNGETATVEVGEWTPIREFNSGKEGIYVYGANIVAKEGVYDVIEDKLMPNENPEDPSAQRTDYVYDVYYRISYFESEDNYNGYERTMEYLDRGVYAAKGKGGVMVSWRLLVDEYGTDIAFNIYRNGKLVNVSPITDKTNYLDNVGRAGDVYVVATIKDGKIYESEEVTALSSNYMSIPVQKPEDQPDKNGVLSTYSMNDASTADVDGDGQYEIIIKWYPSDAFDSGSAVEPSAPTIFDVYEMDGTPLWRLNLGLEMPSGAHFNPFMLYDLDEDGKAELFLKTSDGTVSYKPNADGKFDMTDESTIISYIGDKNVVPGTNINQNGHASSNTNEYVSVFNGMTGEEIDTIDYVNVTGDYADWGKEDGGNRSARYNIAIAYLPEDQDDANCTDTIPAVLYNRGYYDKTTVAAYTLRDGKITLDWNFVVPSGTSNSGKGNHNMATGDVDKDGFDELVIGAMAIDHDGTILWVKNGQDGQDFAGHADSIHLAAMNPDKNDLYVFTPQEEQLSTLNYSLVNAGTGTRWLASWFTKKDVGRGVAANITPYPGYESWAAAGNDSGIYAFDGTLISRVKNVPMNWVLYWDGDLLSELGDGNGAEGNTVISKYNWETETSDVLTTFSGTKMCNWSKNTPSLTADILGDWREEVIVRNTDDTELRIYMTTEKTDYMIYTLMHDPVYRNSVANQNTSYNQPSHVGIYLGEDQRDVVLNMGLDTANVVYATGEVNEEVVDSIENSTADNILENIENAGIDEVADAMQNDPEVLDKVSEIEDEFVANNGITVLEPEVDHNKLDADAVKDVVGVGLNAVENDSTIGLVFEKTPRSEQKDIDKEVFEESVQIDITLVCDGEPIEDRLKAPITITMKVPAGLSATGLWIFHHHDDRVDTIRPVVNADGTITFSVKEFSTFVFANKVSASTGTGSGTGTGSVVGSGTVGGNNETIDADAANREYAERNWNGQEGWQLIGGTWYYFDANGKLVLGWVLAKDGRWYYMNNNGKMATKWVLSPESKLWYYMDPVNGHMLSNGWLCDPDTQLWYYLDPNGAMCTSWIFVDNTWYLLDDNGSMCTGWNLVHGKWYLIGSNGAMLTGWQEVNGKQYYMVETGECLLNTTTPDGHKVNENGERID